MKSTIKKIKQQQTIQPTKITKNRITALLLALLLVTTVLSPTIPVKAQETTAESADITQNNSSDAPTIETNPDGTRTLKFTQSVLHKADNGVFDFTWQHDFTVKGKGKFVIVGYYKSLSSDDPVNFSSYLLSNEIFSCKDVSTTNNGATISTSTWDLSIDTYKGVYYTSLNGFSSFYENSSIYTSGYVNERQTDIYPYKDALKADIDNGNIDLSKDDYMSEDDIANMKPVRDPSIGYLPRARYFDDRKKHTNLGVFNRLEVTSTIQWDSFVEPYSTDLENPYYVEIYAKLHYTTGHRNVDNPSIWDADTPSMKMYQYKKVGKIKYISERFVFPFLEPLDEYLQTLDVTVDASGNTVNSKSETNVFPLTCYVDEYYVRLVHYDYEKSQLLCGGFTKIKLDDKGGSTSSEGDFTDNDPDGDWKKDPDSEGDKNWDDDGDEKDPDNPNPDDPDNPDIEIDTSDIGKFILSLITSLLNSIKSILLLVGEFPSLCGHVFSFLPNDIGTLMFCGVASIVFLRFLGR